jgi:hypothetical protein
MAETLGSVLGSDLALLHLSAVGGCVVEPMCTTCFAKHIELHQSAEIVL